MAKLKVIGRECLIAYAGEQREEVASPYTMGSADYIVVAQEGNCVVKLPLAATCNGYSFYIKRLGANSIWVYASEKPVDPDFPEVTASEKIDGTDSGIPIPAGETVHLYSDGTEFFILGHCL